MNGDAPTLSAGFEIEFTDSFGQLKSLDDLIGEVAANAYREFKKVEQASGGAVNLGGATAQIKTFGSAVSREMQAVARETARAEKAGDALSRQLAREAEAFGKTTAEIRAAKVETTALRLEQAGLTQQANELRTQQAAAVAQHQAAAAAAERQAQALRDAAFAHQAFETRVRQGVAAMREEERAARAAAAAEADLAARAQRLVASINPVAAAQQRFNAQILEARTLVSAGAISLDDYVTKLRIERAALDAVTSAHGRNAVSAGASRQALLGASYQVQDFFTQVSLGANPINAFAVQGAQLAGQFANIEGRAGEVARFFLGPWGLAITGAALVLGYLTKGIFDNDAATGKLTLNLDIQKNSYDTLIRAVHEYNEAQKESAAQTAQATEESKRQTLVLIEQAKVRLADALASERANAGQGTGGAAGAFSGVQAGVRRAELAELREELRKAEKALADQAINARLDKEVEINVRIGKQLNELSAAYDSGKKPLAEYTAERERLLRLKEKELKIARDAKREADSSRPVQVGREIDLAEARRIVESIGGRVTSAQRSTAEQQRLYDKYIAYKNGTGPRAPLAAKPGTSDHEVGNAVDIAKTPGITLAKIRDAFRGQGVAIKQLLDEGTHFHVAWKKGADSAAAATARLTERLAREADAVDAQTKNLYDLSKAYSVSGSAALIAEARVKAESDAIRSRGDVEAFVNQQVKLAIAQRVADSAKGAAAARDQAEAQEAVNARVAAGIVPAAAANDLVKDQLADLPLLAAAQAAQERGLVDEAKKATDAIEEQRKARLRLRDAEQTAQFNADIAAGNNNLDVLREELRLIGATNAERNIALATLRATQEADAKYSKPEDRKKYIDQQVEIAKTTEKLVADQREYNDALNFTADKWDIIARNVQDAAQSLSDAFGRQGRAIGDIASIYANFRANQERAAAALKTNLAAATSEAAKQREIAKYNLANQNAQIGMYANLASAAKSFFKEGSSGYKALAAAEKAFALVQLANTAINVAAGAAKIFASLGPFAFPVVAAMIAVMASLGFSKGGSASRPPETNQGTGTVLGDSQAKSESIVRAISQLREVDTLTLNYSRQMAASLRTIEDNISGFASVLVRNAESINANGNVKAGFNSNAGTVLAGIGGIIGGPIGAGIGALLTKIPIVGDILKGLFGTTTKILGSGLYGGSQSLGNILSGGFDASYYSDIQKKKKLFGITTSNKTSTQYTAADPLLENQFTLILRGFNDAILAAAGPLGASTNEIQQRLNSFVVNIGKIDLQGLTGDQISEKLAAVFGAAADNLATAAFPSIAAFQKAGEGAFETLVRVASTLEAVSGSLDLLGNNAQGISIAAKLALADQFDSVSSLTNAVDQYFSLYYSREEQAAARTAQLASVFQSLGLATPTTLAGFRALVEAQNLNTEAGRAAYATLLQLAPAFADLQAAMDGAKSAVDIAAERQDLERQLLELRGDTAALRAQQLAKLDASNRALQLEIYAIQDAQEAAKAADELRRAWQSVGDSIMDEVRRIRGLSDTAGANSFAALLGQFNSATLAARGGNQDAAKSLPQLSQALLSAAADAATSRQELDRIRAQTAASLEATYGLISGFIGTATPSSNTTLLNAALASQPLSVAINDNASSGDRFEELRAETAQLRIELTNALAQIAGNTAKVAKKLDDVTAQSGGDAISTVAA